MSSRSKVAIALKKNVADNLRGSHAVLIVEDSDQFSEIDGNLFAVFDDIRWPIVSDVAKDNDSGDVFENLIGFLKTQPENDYLVVEACYDYPETTDGDMGKWTDNPWNIRRVFSVDISFNDY